MRIKSNDARILYHAGMIEKDLGNRGEAARLLAKALELNPAFDLFQAEKRKNRIAGGKTIELTFITKSVKKHKSFRRSAALTRSVQTLSRFWLPANLTRRQRPVLTLSKFSESDLRFSAK